MEGQALLSVLGSEWSRVALTDKALITEANMFSPLSNLGLMEYGSGLFRMLL